MIAIGSAVRRVGLWPLLCSVIFSTTPAASEDGAKALTHSGALIEVMAQPGPPGLMGRGYFADNPGCVRAKLDIWLARGRHTHQLFMPRAEPDSAPLPAPPDQATATRDPPVQTVMDENGTTILVGSEGCRIRIRIDRAE
jgi:hypothetical protein